MGLNKQLYQELEEYLEKCGIEELAEDLLLAVAEELEELDTVGEMLSCRLDYDSIIVTASGYCEAEDDETRSVYINEMIVDKRLFVIRDYVM